MQKNLGKKNIFFLRNMLSILVIVLFIFSSILSLFSVEGLSTVSPDLGTDNYLDSEDIGITDSYTLDASSINGLLENMQSKGFDSLDAETKAMFNDYFDIKNIEPDILDKLLSTDTDLRIPDYMDFSDFANPEINDFSNLQDSEEEISILSSLDLNTEERVNADMTSLPSDFTGEPFVYDSNGDFLMYLSEFEELEGDMQGNYVSSDLQLNSGIGASAEGYDSVFPSDIYNDANTGSDGESDTGDEGSDGKTEDKNYSLFGKTIFLYSEPSPTNEYMRDRIDFPAMSAGGTVSINDTVQYDIIKQLDGKSGEFIVYEPLSFSSFGFSYSYTPSFEGLPDDNTYGDDGGTHLPDIDGDGIPDDEEISIFPVYYEASVDYDINGGIFPFPQSDEPWIELINGSGLLDYIKLSDADFYYPENFELLGGLSDGQTFIKVNSSALDPGTYCAHIDVTVYIPDSASTDENINFVPAHFTKTLVITIWPDENSGSSVRFSILGNPEDEIYTYYSGGSAYMFSVIVDLKEYVDTAGDCLYWIHSYGKGYEVLPNEFGRISADEEHHYIRIMFKGSAGFFETVTEGEWVDSETYEYTLGKRWGENAAFGGPVMLHMFPDYENADDISNNEIIYRFNVNTHVKDPEINYKPTENLSYIDNLYTHTSHSGGMRSDLVHIITLPSVGEDFTVEQGEVVNFALLSYNPLGLGYMNYLLDLGVHPMVLLRYMVVELSLSWNKEGEPLNVDGITVPQTNLRPGGSPGGEGIQYMPYGNTGPGPASCGPAGFLGRMLGLMRVGDIAGRMIHHVNIPTHDLEPGTYTKWLRVHAYRDYPDEFLPPPEREYNDDGTWTEEFIPAGVKLHGSIPIRFTVLPKSDNKESTPDDTYSDEVVNRMVSLDSYKTTVGPIGLDEKLNYEKFDLLRRGNGSKLYQASAPLTEQSPFMDLVGWDPNIGPNYGYSLPGIIPDDKILVCDRSYSFSIFPKQVQSIDNGMDADAAVISLHPHAYFWAGDKVGSGDPAVGRPPTPLEADDYSTYAGINGKVVRIDPAPPFESLKTTVLDTSQGSWSQNIPPTYDHDPCPLGTAGPTFHPDRNVVDLLDWNHRRNPHVGSWVDNIDNVAPGTKLTFRIDLDLTSLGEPGMAADLIYPLDLEYLLPAGLDYQAGSAKARLGLWWGQKNPAAYCPMKKLLFSWGALPFSFEPDKIDNSEGKLVWNIRPGNGLLPLNGLGLIPGSTTGATDPPWGDPINSLAIFGRPVEYDMLNYFPTPVYDPIYIDTETWSGGVTTIEITFDAVVTNQCDITCNADLYANIEDQVFITPKGPSPRKELGYNPGENIEMIPISKDTVSVSTRNTNNPPVIEEIVYPNNGETDVPVMNDKLSVCVSDPDGDRVSVSFYWASEDCVEKQSEFSGRYQGSPFSINGAYEWVTKRTLIHTKYNVITGSVVSVDPRPVYYFALPEYAVPGGHVQMADPVITGLDFNKQYSWYVVVSDGCNSTQSNVYSFTTKDSKPETKVEYTPLNPRVGENISVDLKSNIYDPENLIRGIRWSCLNTEDLPWVLGDECFEVTQCHSNPKMGMISLRDANLSFYVDITANPGSKEYGNSLVKNPFDYTLRVLPMYSRCLREYAPTHYLFSSTTQPIQGEHVYTHLTDYIPGVGGIEAIKNIEISSRPFAKFKADNSSPAVDQLVKFDASNSYDAISKEIINIEDSDFDGTYIPTNSENGLPIPGSDNAYGYFPNKGAITAYHWDFGDGSYASTDVADHSYSGPGLYNVTLTVTDNENLNDSITKTIIVEDSTGGDSGSGDDGSDGSDGGDTDDGSGDGSDDDGSTGEVSIEFVKPLQGCIYFRNKSICTFPKTVIIGNIELKVNVNVDSTATVSNIKFYVDGAEKADIGYESGESVYSYLWKGRAFFSKTIKVAAFDGSEEIASQSLDAFVLNLFV